MTPCSFSLKLEWLVHKMRNILKQNLSYLIVKSKSQKKMMTMNIAITMANHIMNLTRMFKFKNMCYKTNI